MSITLHDLEQIGYAHKEELLTMAHGRQPISLMNEFNAVRMAIDIVSDHLKVYSTTYEEDQAILDAKQVLPWRLQAAIRVRLEEKRTHLATLKLLKQHWRSILLGDRDDEGETTAAPSAAASSSELAVVGGGGGGTAVPFMIRQYESPVRNDLALLQQMVEQASAPSSGAGSLPMLAASHVDGSRRIGVDGPRPYTDLGGEAAISAPAVTL